METKASYLIVGAFVITLVVGIVVFVIWLANIQLRNEYDTYLVYFRGSVTGLQTGGSVRYRGIPVGSVGEMRINPENVEEIEVTINVKKGTPIRADTIASIETTGLTGTAYIQLSGGTQSAPPLVPPPGKKYAVIQSRPSRLEKVFSSAPQALEKLDQVADRLMLLLNDHNLHDITETLDNIRTVSAAVAAKRGQIQAAIEDGTSSVRELRNTLESVRRFVDHADAKTSEVSAQLTPAVTELRKTAESLDRLSNELEAVVAENRQPIKDFSGQGLYELTQLLTETRGMVATVTRLAKKIEADPARFLFGNQQQGGVKPQ